ncbi:hypothetical protein E3N88_10254 [Mikania micrantha]|uniref:Integrase catalytic domain-containing protein n=1 Tax=Mikania micrantha TaxID=192012 RepID=A0A5N6PAA0_9ASTR|nr:hypothetical protein E3N88_10254 [Mikania micrantha]
MESSSRICTSPSFNRHSSADRVMQELCTRNGFEDNDILSFSDDDNPTDVVTDIEVNTHNLTKVAMQNMNENQKDDSEENEENEEGEFEFPVVRRDLNLSTDVISDDQISISLRYPVFDRSLLSEADLSFPTTDYKQDPTTATRPSLWKLLRVEGDLPSAPSLEVDDLDGITPGTYCVWKPATVPRGKHKHKKNNSISIGNTSKRWKVRNLLKRSYSDDNYPTGKDSPVVVFLPPISPDRTTNNEKVIKIEKSGKLASAVDGGVASTEKNIPAYKSKAENIHQQSPRLYEKIPVDIDSIEAIESIWWLLLAHDCNFSQLHEVTPFNGGYVSSAGDKGRKISMKGRVMNGTLSFEDVYYVEELNHSLLSVSHNCDKTFSTHFTNKECLILNLGFVIPEKWILMRSSRIKNAYIFNKNSDSFTENTCLFSKALETDCLFWHRRLGHVNLKSLNSLAKGDHVIGLPSKEFSSIEKCIACAKGKHHKRPHQPELFNSISSILQLIHTDLFGPVNVMSIEKKSYCLVITDDYSRFTWVFFLDKKDKTLEILKKFITLIENQKNLEMKVIRTDNGTEFRNQTLVDFCDEKGIARQYSATRTPQQNGVAERRNITLIEAARTMLSELKIPIFFCAEAVNTTCYVQNRALLNKCHQKTPYEIFFNQKPKVSHFKSFGCPCTLLHTKPNHKFDDKSDECYFVGYSADKTVYRVYNKKTQQIVGVGLTKPKDSFYKSDDMDCKVDYVLCDPKLLSVDQPGMYQKAQPISEFLPQDMEISQSALPTQQTDQTFSSSHQTFDNPLFSNHIPTEHYVDNDAEESETTLVDNTMSSNDYSC